MKNSLLLISLILLGTAFKSQAQDLGGISTSDSPFVTGKSCLSNSDCNAGEQCYGVDNEGSATWAGSCVPVSG